MATVPGRNIEVGYGIESTQNTAVAADTFLKILSEDLTAHTVPLFEQGFGGGQYVEGSVAVGEKVVGGSVTMECRTAAMADMLRLCIGGDPTPTDADPVFTRAFTMGALPSSTWEVKRGTQVHDYVGMMVDTWSLTQNASQNAQLQLGMMGYDEVTGGAAATFAPPATPGILRFRDLTSTTPDGAVCFDSVTINGTNGLRRNVQSCAADAGRAQIGEDAQRSITGTLLGDYADDLTAHNRQIAGTTGTLTLAWSLSAAASLTFALNVVYMPTVSANAAGPGVMKQAIPFKVVGATPATVTLVNGES